MQEWGPVIVALIAGVTSAPLWTYFTRLLGIGQTELERLRNLVQRYEVEIAELKERLAIVEHHHSSFYARWIRDAHKRIVWVNDKALLAIFAPLGLSRESIDGRTFHDVLDPKSAAEIDEMDAAALAFPGQPVSKLLQLHPDLPYMHVVKVAGAGRSGELIYEGLAFRTNDRAIATGFGINRQAQARAVAIDRLSTRDDEAPPK